MRDAVVVNDIKEIIRRHIDLLRAQYHVKTIGVFGSVARETATSSSDVDLLVEFEGPIGFFQFIDLEEFLSRILERKVDLVTKNALKPALKDAVLRDVVYV